MVNPWHQTPQRKNIYKRWNTPAEYSSWDVNTWPGTILLGFKTNRGICGGSKKNRGICDTYMRQETETDISRNKQYVFTYIATILWVSYLKRVPMFRHIPGCFIRYPHILFNLGYDVCDIKLLYFYWQTIQICRAVVANLPLKHPLLIWYRIKIASKLITCLFHTYNNQYYIMYIWYKL